MRWTSSAAPRAARGTYHACMAGVCCALSVAACLAPTSALAATAAQIATARANALAYLYTTQNADGSWGSQPGVQVAATSAAVESLLAAGVSRGATLSAAVTALANTQPVSTDGLARQLDTLYHAGNDTSAEIAQLNAAANVVSAWGTLAGQGSNVADTALAVTALVDASTTYSNTAIATALCNVIVPGQTASGGWGYLPKPATTNAPSGLATPAILPTAYAILALQKVNASRFTSMTCAGTGVTLSTLMTNGVTWLLTKKNADNGFGEAGASGALETALAYRAIAAVAPGNAVLGPAQDYLIASQRSNGSWAADPLQTAFVVQSFGGAVLTDSKGIGVPDAVAAVIWPAGQTADPRGLIAGNGQSVKGQTVSTVVGAGSVNQSFTGHLPTPSGTGPFTYKLLSGNLPDGVTLAADGTLSGTATVSGTFNFTYQVTDATGAVTILAGEIDTGPDGDVPTLPEWGALLLGMLLLTFATRQARLR